MNCLERVSHSIGIQTACLILKGVFMQEEVLIKSGDLILEGHVAFNSENKGWVIFAHGSGSSRKSPRNNWVSEELNQHGYSCFLFDLLTSDEDEFYSNRFNIPLLTQRLLIATNWLIESKYYDSTPLAYFGASTGAAAALQAATLVKPEWNVKTVISRGGRPDLAGEKFLSQVNLPVLLIVGEYDFEVIELNRKASEVLKNSQISIIPEATHLFEEEGALHLVVQKTYNWLDHHLAIQSKPDIFDSPSPI
jgi:predicted alpha/beta-hydrolase family hydrolase